MADFDWRISVAEVREPGPFSSLPGVDRLLLLVEGDAMGLVVDGVAEPASRERALAFRGESEVVCASLPSGPTVDLNVMTRRGRFTASLEVRPAEAVWSSSLPGACVVVVPLRDGVTADGERLGPLDVAFVDESVALRGPAMVARIVIVPA